MDAAYNEIRRRSDFNVGTRVRIRSILFQGMGTLRSDITEPEALFEKLRWANTWHQVFYPDSSLEVPSLDRCKAACDLYKAQQ